VAKLIEVETERHKEAYAYFKSLGPGRKLASVARRYAVSQNSVQLWAKSFGWRERVVGARPSPVVENRSERVGLEIKRLAKVASAEGSGCYGLLDTKPAKRLAQRSSLGPFLSELSSRIPLSEGLSVLCLPGASGWDARFFSECPAVSRVVGVERDSEVSNSLRAAVASEPKVEVVESDLATYLETTRERFDLVYFDYFSNFNFAVEWHLRVLLRRQILRPGGVYAANFLGARESLAIQSRNRVLFEDLATGESWDSAESARRRLVAFNSLLAGFRRHPVRESVGGREGFFADFGLPSWSSYKTKSASMFSCCSRLFGYPNSPLGPKRGAKEAWTLDDGRTSVEEFTDSSLKTLRRLEGRAAVVEHRRAMCRRFYAENGYAPSAREIGIKRHPGWSDLLRSAGLCPRIHPSAADLRLALRNLAKRAGGVVSIGAILAARIPLAALGSTDRKRRAALEEMCCELGLEFDKRTAGLEVAYLRGAWRAEELLVWLDAGNPLPEVGPKHWISRRGFQDRGKLLAAVHQFRLERQSGRWDSFTRPPFSTPNANSL